MYKKFWNFLWKTVFYSVCELHIGDVKRKQIHRFNYLGCFISDDKRCSTVIRSRVRIGKDTFQKIIKVLKDMKNLLETKKIIYSIHIVRIVILIFIYNISAVVFSGPLQDLSIFPRLGIVTKYTIYIVPKNTVNKSVGLNNLVTWAKDLRVQYLAKKSEENICILFSTYH